MFERKSSCPANTKHLYNIYTTSAQRLKRWSKTLYKVRQMCCVHWVWVQAWGQPVSKYPQ